MKKLIALMILMASPQLWANTCDWPQWGYI